MRQKLALIGVALPTAFLVAAFAGAAGFVGASRYEAGAAPYGVATGDLNGDGRPDVAVADKDGDAVSILLGAGNGSLQPAHSVAAGFRPTDVVRADFNGTAIPTSQW